jgi:hypothetical protein
METNFISSSLFNATNVQNGHRFFLDKFQSDSNMHTLRFVTFPAGLAKNMFFLFKTKHTVFFILNSFFCLKHVLNLVKKNMF